MEVPILDEDPIGYISTGYLNFMLGLYFNNVGIDSDMTHVMVLSAKVRRKGRLWYTLDIDNMFGPTFNSNLDFKNKIVEILQPS